MKASPGFDKFRDKAIRVKGRTPSKAWRPKKPVDWKLVEALCQIQCTGAEISSVLDMHWETFQKAVKEKWNCSVKELLDEWGSKGKASLRRKQWNIASRNASMAIFLGKQYLGQRDYEEHAHTGQVEFNIVNYGDLEPVQWKEKENLPPLQDPEFSEDDIKKFEVENLPDPIEDNEFIKSDY